MTLLKMHLGFMTEFRRVNHRVTHYTSAAELCSLFLFSETETMAETAKLATVFNPAVPCLFPAFSALPLQVGDEP